MRTVLRRGGERVMPRSGSGRFRRGGFAGPPATLAECCAVHPGDPIVAYVSIASGITIHHRDCKRAQAMLRRSSPGATRRGGPGRGGPVRSEVEIDAWDRRGLLD